MTVQLILNPSWTMAEVEHGKDIMELARTLITIMKRDGVQDACDKLSEYWYWSVLDAAVDSESKQIWPENATGWETTVVDGYGLAYVPGDAASDGDFEASIGIMTDGAILLYHHASKSSCAFGLEADNIEEKLAAFEEDIATL